MDGWATALLVVRIKKYVKGSIMKNKKNIVARLVLAGLVCCTISQATKPNLANEIEKIEQERNEKETLAKHCTNESENKCSTKHFCLGSFFTANLLNFVVLLVAVVADPNVNPMESVRTHIILFGTSALGLAGAVIAEIAEEKAADKREQLRREVKILDQKISDLKKLSVQKNQPEDATNFSNFF